MFNLSDKNFKILHTEYCSSTNCKIIEEINNGNKKRKGFCKNYCEVYNFLKWLHNNDYEVKRKNGMNT